MTRLTTLRGNKARGQERTRLRAREDQSSRFSTSSRLRGSTSSPTRLSRSPAHPPSRAAQAHAAALRGREKDKRESIDSE